ncbi:MAG: hypothetical protein HYY62_03025 [Deltaproteobacteria bacterium]|nr:hypothetical protein [Deltaproteobacteria bacterium]
MSPQKRKPTSLLVKQESKAIEQWTKDFIEASGENRNKILKQRLSDMKKNSLTVLPEMIERLQELPAHHQTERVSLFLALGEVGPTVSQEARTLIQGIVNQELTKPDQAKISLDPQTIDFHHNTQFQKKEDGVYLSNVSTKLAALDTLRTIGDKESIQKLIEIAKDPSQPQYLRNAADDAILSFLDPAEAAKIRAALN